MGNRTRITILLMRQLVFGISYVYKTLFIGVLCFNIQIDCTKFEMNFFQFINLFNE